MDPDAVGDGEWGRRGMGVLDGDRDRRRGRGSFGVNWDRPIVTNGDLAMRLYRNYFRQYLLLGWHTVA